MSAPAAGAAQTPCPAALFEAVSQGTLAPARVGGGPRVYFRREGAGCPSERDGCRARAYVVPGDVVVAGPVTPDGRYVCAAYPSAHGPDGYSGGWVLASELSPAAHADDPPALGAWAGDWTRGGADLTLRPAGAAIRVRGDALLEIGPPEAGRSRTGEVAGTAHRRGSSYTVTREDCVVDFELVGRALVVNDNGRCGGAGVTFAGVYRRR